MSKRNDAVIEAHLKGYRVLEDGSVVSGKGKSRKLRAWQDKIGYWRVTFNIRSGDRSVPILVAKLQAFQMFGYAVFESGVQVRHLDGDPTNNTPKNLALGSGSDNAMDRPVIDRKLHAQKAGRVASPHTEEFWARVAADHSEGASYRTLEKRYGVSRASLSFRLSKTAKRQVMQHQAR